MFLLERDYIVDCYPMQSVGFCLLHLALLVLCLITSKSAFVRSLALLHPELPQCASLLVIGFLFGFLFIRNRPAATGFFCSFASGVEGHFVIP